MFRLKLSSLPKSPNYTKAQSDKVEWLLLYHLKIILKLSRNLSLWWSRVKVGSVTKTLKRIQ